MNKKLPPLTDKQIKVYHRIKAKHELQKKLKWYYEYRDKYDKEHPSGVKRLTAWDDGRILNMDAESENGWVTMNGTHVLIGEGGEVVGGPSNLSGKKYPNAKSIKSKAKTAAKSIEQLKRKWEDAKKESDSIASMGEQEMKAYLLANGFGEKYVNSIEGGVLGTREERLKSLASIVASDKVSKADKALKDAQNGESKDDKPQKTSNVTAEKPQTTETKAAETPKPEQLGTETKLNTASTASKEAKAEAGLSSKNSTQNKETAEISSKEKVQKAKAEVEVVKNMTAQEQLHYLNEENGKYKNKDSYWLSERNRDFIKEQAIQIAQDKVNEAQALAKYENGVPKGRGHIDTKSMYLQVMEDTGADKSSAKEIASSIYGYTKFNYKNVRNSQVNGRPDNDARNIEKYIEKAPKWNGGTLYRGITVDSYTAKEILDNAKSGQTFDQKGVSSWTSSKRNGDDFASLDAGRYSTKIVYRTKETKKGSSVRCFSANPEEDEVLISSTARWKATKISKQGGTYYIDCEEVE